ncbi:pyocin knob domain-containing protein, partial [Escherichia coli]|nr:pyocin knob domain-containing protein [Escherichia coli]MCN7175528.1 pyocin knob domain-containing protein [Escherichia coli]
YQSESRYYEGDLNDVTSPGIYSVTGKATNGPVLDGNGVTVLGILEVLRRFDGVNVWQRYTTAGTGTTLKGRTFERVFTGSSWSEWREVYTSYSLPLNLGIGGAVAKLTSLDWQTYDFVPGSLITVRLDNMTNIPDGMDWGVIDGNLINISVGPSDDSGSGRSMHVWRSTVSKANYRFFMVRISGNPGSRTITTRRVPIIDEAQTWSAHQTFSGGLGGELSGNAATATKLQTARTIGGVSFDGTANINLPGVNTAGNQSTTGNAATATKLQTARTIGGVSFDGSANINLPGVNIAGNQNTTGNAATATKLQTARTINDVKFDGSANISIPTITSRGRVTALTSTTQGATTGLQMYEAYNNGYPSAYGNVLHLKGATVAGEGELFIGWSGTSGAHAPVHVRSRRDTDTASWSEWAQVYTSKDSIPGVNTTGNQNTTGNAASATKLQTARTIGGVSFNGTANIDLPGVNKTGNQSTTGNAATATKLQTARTIGGVSFDGTANINLPGVNIAGNQNTSGNAATATKLKTARKISGVAFDGSADITLTASHVGALPTTGGTVTGEIISSSQNAIRLTYNNNYGFLITNTGYSFQISTTGQNVNGDVVYTPLKIDGGDGRVELGRADGHVRVMGNLSAVGQITPGNYSNFNTKYQAKNTAYANIHGWHKDTSTKVMMQWGFITNLTPGSVVNFPTTFPEACAVVVISPHSGNAVNSILYTYNHSATGFTVKSSSTDKIYAQYVAYGY